MVWPVLAQSYHWTDAPSMDGASTTVGILEMQEWCAKVGSFVCSPHTHTSGTYVIDSIMKGGLNSYVGTKSIEETTDLCIQRTLN